MDFTLDFAHLETGQYKNSPNAWKLTSKTAPWPETYRGKKAWGKKKKKKTINIDSICCTVLAKVTTTCLRDSPSFQEQV